MSVLFQIFFQLFKIYKPCTHLDTLEAIIDKTHGKQLRSSDLFLRWSRCDGGKAEGVGDCGCQMMSAMREMDGDLVYRDTVEAIICQTHGGLLCVHD